MNQPWLPPKTIPFERLNVIDGLLMNSQRWQLAHDYHQRRQNVLYQCLNEPGIVCGLEVCLIAAPETVKPEYRDKRWLEIQPGIAIDRFGNLIVVDKPINYRLQSEPSVQATTIYLVVSYVDPGELHYHHRPETLKEVYRLDEKLIPSEQDVEVCRIQLAGEAVALQLPQDVFTPQINELDLRYRSGVKARSQGQVWVAAYQDTNQLQGITTQENPVSNLAYLYQALPSLYPELTGINDNRSTFLQADSLTEIATYDLLYFTAPQIQSLDNSALGLLQEYHQTGGAIAIEISDGNYSLGEIQKVKQDLEKAIASVAILDEFANYEESLKSELDEIDGQLKIAIQPLLDWCDRVFETQLTPLTQLKQHPLRSQPFLFSALPTINNESISIWCDRGIVLILGNLASAWGLNHRTPLSREHIRTAQEMGINLLHFAWKRKQLNHCKDTATLNILPASPPRLSREDTATSSLSLPTTPTANPQQSQPPDTLF
ncbi:MAG: hypothetical protein SAJ12_09695 [Jaaginema sp. PMC 1079.18]|nr:hypothetical protein [Jaaginema sp. PMC 1080.18]MEC4851273.1 hypothetical protein [Jaaginema sp. PMC 1079.18]MEC4867608.1 hypothetical protein [Jaaginema sp. PMC 1078.18]